MSHDNVTTPLVEASFDRRGLFRIGGLTIAGAAIIAACSDSNAVLPGEVGRVGVGAPNPTLLDPIINNGVLLRTSASIETSIADAYQHMLDQGLLSAPSPTFPDLGDQSNLVKGFLEQHRKAAESFNALAQEAGGEPWTCGNPRLDNAFITPLFTRVESGAPATDTAKAIEPSDDPTRDMVNLVVALEQLSASTSQALMTQVTEPSYRAEAMRLAVRSARQSALMSLKINPGAYVTGSDVEAANPAAPTTEAPHHHGARRRHRAPDRDPAAGGHSQPVRLVGPHRVHRCEWRRERCANEAHLRDAEHQLVRLPVRQVRLTPTLPMW